MYNSAYPLGVRLGITFFWPAAAIQQRFFSIIARANIVMTQWLVLWFYTQRIYLTAIELIDNVSRIDQLHINFSYFCVPRSLWKKKRRKSIRKSKRRKKIKKFLRIRRFWQKRASKFFFIFRKNKKKLLKRPYLFFQDLLVIRNQHAIQLSINSPESSRSVSSGLAYRYGTVLYGQTQWVAKRYYNLINRVVSGFYKNSRGPQYIKPESFTPLEKFFDKKHVRAKKRNPFFKVILRASINKFIHQKSWLRRTVYQRRRFFKKQFNLQFRRLSLSFSNIMNHIRMLWYVKICIDTYYRQSCVIHGTNLYSYYFQPSPISRLAVRNRRFMGQYIQTKTRFSQERTLALQVQRPAVINKFTYTQLVLFLGLQPKWRKFVNAYILSYLVIISAILKNVQVLAQWLYTVIINGHTRRLRQMRMQFFSLVATLLRNFGVFGQYIRGFRIEVLGKTGRSQKTQTRLFGDTNGLRFFSLSLRLDYQFFEIPTFAGILGVHFWIY